MFLEPILSYFDFWAKFDVVRRGTPPTSVCACALYPHDDRRGMCCRL